MHDSPVKLRRLAADLHADRLERAARARLLAELRPDPLERHRLGAVLPRPRDLRWRFADLLLELAARLSPAHRDALCALRPSACAPRPG